MPRRGIRALALLVLALAFLVILAAAQPARAFTDVVASNPYRGAIDDVSGRGIVSGYADGTFRPGNPLYRAQFAKMICRTMGIAVTEATPHAFKDLGADSSGSLYPHEYVGAAAQEGIILGYAGRTFHPYTNVTRAQVITMVVRAANNLDPGALDVPLTGFVSQLGRFDPTHATTMAWAEYNGLLRGLQGYGKGWDPWVRMTRGETAQVLHNLLGTLSPSEPPSHELVDPSAGSCADCHSGDLVTGHVTDHGMGCEGCHGPAAPAAVRAVVTTFAASAANPSCGDCHLGGSYHGGMSQAHTITPAADCAACHQAFLPGEHFRGSSVSGAAGCQACHPLPADFVWSGSCDDCHRSDGLAPVGHTSLGTDHESSQTDCVRSGCHAGSVMIVHSATPAGCATCHSTSTAPSGTDCLLCHSDGAGHATVHEADVGIQAAYAACADCHALNLATEHVGGHALTCDTCHAADAPQATKDALAAWATTGQKQGCAACHGADAGDHATLHASTVGTDCADCHQPNLINEHVDARGFSCATCHKSAVAAVVAAIQTGDTSCVACHVGGSHQVLHNTDIGGCSQCHQPNLIDEHVNGQALTCGACHDSAVPAVVEAIAGGDRACGACHDLAGHPYVAGTHTASVSGTQISGALVTPAGTPLLYWDNMPQTYGGQTCGACHSMDLAVEHGKPSSAVPAAGCSACHPQPRGSFTSWNKTCQQGGCHTAYHADMATKHVRTYTTSDCSSSRSCHPEFQSDVAAIHNDAWYQSYIDSPNGCYACHSAAAVPEVVICRAAGCHDGSGPITH